MTQGVSESIYSVTIYYIFHCRLIEGVSESIYSVTIYKILTLQMDLETHSNGLQGVSKSICNVKI